MANIKNQKIITIFGTSKADTSSPVYKLAYQLGELLVQAGFTVANGGYGGTMLAAAKAAFEAGGKTIGVTCSAFGKSKANKYISREIVTKSLDERLKTLVELGQGYIVLSGGTGTLLELAKVWELKNKGFLQAEKPIIIIGSFWKPLLEVIASEDSKSKRFIVQEDKPEQVIDILKRCI